MSLNIRQQIESLLFISGKPLSFKKISELAGGGVKEKDAQKAVEELSREYAEQERGVRLAVHGKKAQMVTDGGNSEIVQKFIKDEISGELTKPSIETLTIIAYRGPITKLELERIRGINCSLILRNLMIRGLVEEKKESNKGAVYYNLTLDFIKYLGVNKTKELPDYEKFRNNEDLDKFLKGEV